MNTLLTIFISVAVAGAVGGVTNYLAIKMLFHPRTEWRVFGRKVPLTPGLIPKRRDEIARSLGHIVAAHLVTSESLAGVLAKPEFRASLEAGLKRRIDTWSESEETVEQALSRIWTPEQMAAGKAFLADWLDRQTETQLLRLWEERLARLTVAELLPGWREERKRETAEWAAANIALKIAEQLDEPAGEQLLKKMAFSFMDRAGGWLGTLAGLFVDEDKLVGKVKSALKEQLVSPALQSWLTRLLEEGLTRLEAVTLDEAARLVGGPSLEKRLAAAAVELVSWPDQLERLGRMPLSALLAPRKDWLAEQAGAFGERALDWLAGNMDRLVEAVRLPQLVETEVRRFPMERIEAIILNVTGKEFRAITWLGVFLGGIIGLMQSVFLLLVR